MTLRKCCQLLFGEGAEDSDGHKEATDKSRAKDFTNGVHEVDCLRSSLQGQNRALIAGRRGEQPWLVGGQKSRSTEPVSRPQRGGSDDQRSSRNRVFAGQLDLAPLQEVELVRRSGFGKDDLLLDDLLCDECSGKRLTLLNAQMAENRPLGDLVI